MATNPQLIVALDARLDKFEKSLKDAGLIAEREIAKIEDKFSKANPSFGGAFGGGFLGGLLGAGAIHQIEEIAKKLLEINNQIAKIGETAEVAGVSTDRLQETLFALTRGGGSREQASKDIESIAVAVSEASRQENALSKLLDENNIKRGQTLTYAEALPKLSQLAADATAVQRVELAKLLGISRETVDALSVGPELFQQLENDARKAGAVLEETVIEKAKKFKAEWAKATQDVANMFLAFAAKQSTDYLSGVVESTSRDLKLITDLYGTAIAKLTEIWTKFKEGIWGPTAATPEGGLGGALKQIANSPFGLGNKEEFGPPIPKGFGKGGNGINLPSKATGSGGGLDSFEKELDRLEKSAALQEAETKALGLNAEARARLRAEAALTEAVLKGEIEVTDELIKKWGETVDRIGEAARAHQQATELLSAFKAFGADLSTGFQAAIFEGKKLNDVLKDMLRSLASRSLNKLFETLSTNAFNTFAGPRAGGGPVNVGKTYLVGERGPELFRPGASGMVIPNSLSGGGGAARVSLVVNNSANANVGQPQVSTGADGAIMIQLAVEAAVSEVAGQVSDSRGPVGGALRGRHGLRPVMRRR